MKIIWLENLVHGTYKINAEVGLATWYKKKYLLNFMDSFIETYRFRFPDKKLTLVMLLVF